MTWKLCRKKDIKKNWKEIIGQLKKNGDTITVAWEKTESQKANTAVKNLV